ncbi:MAG: LysR family transcriptional regulator [Ruminococcaceae bacterium]|jgi:DNA-binding transcriptional LysR family regulator|nr:LysR family transcriptional regulator [Oscillospiraceae bacterium]
MIDPKLNTILSVAETLNITKSSKLLSMTQPAVSQHIKSVENTLGVKLFVRTNKGLKVTPQGDIVINYARKMKGLYGVLLQELKDEQRSMRHLTVGVTPTAENNMISQVLAMYSIQNPSVRITIIVDTINNLYAKLKEYEIDFAIIEGMISDPSYASILLDTDYLVMAAANDNPLSKQPMVSLEKLKNERLILRLPGSGTRTLFETSLLSKGESLDSFNIILELDNLNTIKDLVESNFGVSIISKSACLDDVRRKRFQTVPIENLSMIREINIIYPRDFAHGNILSEIVKLYHARVNTNNK